MKTNYIIKIGETLRLQLLKVDVSDYSTIQGIETKMKKAGPNGSVPSADAPIVASFATEATAEGWDFVLTDEQTALLEVGVYVADAKIALNNGGVVKTESVTIRVDPSVT
jgi:hypothetical protein